MRFTVGEARTGEEVALLPKLIREYGDLCNSFVKVQPDAFGIVDSKDRNCSALESNDIAIVQCWLTPELSEAIPNRIKIRFEMASVTLFRLTQ
jgi:hypothetical protein